LRRYLRFDTNDYSLDPALVGGSRRGARRPARGHRRRFGHGRAALPARRVFARHRTITALEHARKLRRAHDDSAESPVEVRPLAVNDQLIA
jgi:hypothetical protein